MKTTNKQKTQNNLCNIFLVAALVLALGFSIAFHNYTVSATTVNETKTTVDSHYVINHLKLELFDDAIFIAAHAEYEGNAAYNSSTSSSKIIKFLVNKSINTNYTGKISASYNLENLQFEATEEGIKVIVPEVEIYTNEADFINCKSDDAIFSSDINYYDFENLRNKVEEEEKEIAINEGLYTRAQASLEKNIRNLVKEITNEDVKVIFEFM